MTQLQTEQGIVRVPAGTWRVDPTHSSVAFEVKHLMIATVRGHFSDFDGSLEAAEDDPSNSHAWGVVRVASIDTGNPDRDAHLRSPDFFDAERYPEMRFETLRIEHVEGGRYRVAGDLTIKDTTREVEIDATVEGAATDPWGNERVGIAVRGSIDRTEFGLTWQRAAAGGGLLVGEEVGIVIDVSAVRAGPT
jgi:polyisoprenoid-binding protein YceI